jgi:hypothetical protein
LATNEILSRTQNSPIIPFHKGDENKNELIKKVLNTGLDNSQKKIKVTSEGQSCRKC